MLANLIQGDEKFNMQLHVREWVNIDPEWEFRTFITNNEMTACTQYYSLCFVPQMVPIKDQIRDRIYNFWKENLKYEFLFSAIFFFKIILDCIVRSPNAHAQVTAVLYWSLSGCLHGRFCTVTRLENYSRHRSQ